LRAHEDRASKGEDGAFSSEVDAGSRQENASKQESRAPFRFNRNGKGSSEKLGLNESGESGDKCVRRRWLGGLDKSDLSHFLDGSQDVEVQHPLEALYETTLLFGSARSAEYLRACRHSIFI
jgi:hypothetical protein